MISNLVDKTFGKFILVGIANTLFGSAIMFIFYNIFHLNYWISSASNYIFGSILSYFLNKYYTFNSKSKSWSEVIKFAINITVCYLIAYGITKPLVMQILSNYALNIQENMAMLVGMGLFVILNYFGQRFFIFNK